MRPVSSTAPTEISARRQETRERLIAAGAAVMADKGTQVGVAEICEAAGFTRGAFYSNFADRDELITAIMEEHVQQVVDAIDQLREEDLRPEDLADVVARLLPLAQPERGFKLISAEIMLEAARDPEQYAGRVAPLERLFGRVTDAVVEGLAGIGLRFTVDPEDAFRVIVAVAESSHQQALVHGDEDISRLARITLPPILTALTEPLPG